MIKDGINRREFLANVLAIGAVMGAAAICPSPLHAAMQFFGAQKLDPLKVKENPQWLNNKTFTGKLPKGALVIENAHIKNATFSDFEAEGCIFENVIFENCHFYRADMWKSEFGNVTIKGGIMANMGDRYYTTDMINFLHSAFKGVTIDGTTLSFTFADPAIARKQRIPPKPLPLKKQY